MDRINKFLQRLSKKEFLEAEQLIERILADDIDDLNVKKLKGVSYLFRVRKGDIRIIFQRNKGEIRIIDIERRGEHTYRNLIQ